MVSSYVSSNVVHKESRDERTHRREREREDFVHEYRVRRCDGLSTRVCVCAQMTVPRNVPLVGEFAFVLSIVCSRSTKAWW